MRGNFTGGLPNESLRSEEHTSELQSHHDLVCRLLLEKKKPSSCAASALALATGSSDRRNAAGRKRESGSHTATDNAAVADSPLARSRQSASCPLASGGRPPSRLAARSPSSGTAPPDRMAVTAAGGSLAAVPACSAAASAPRAAISL